MKNQNVSSRLNLPTLPIAYPQLLLKILEERGIARQAVLPGTGLHAGLLEQADARVSPLQWGQLAFKAIELSGDEGIGCEFGLRAPLSVHGFLGYAVMTAQTLRETVAVVIQYYRTRSREYSLHYAEVGHRAVLELRPRDPLPVLEHHFVIETILIALAQGLQSLIADARSDIQLGFKWPEPDYHARYRPRLPPVNFSSPVNELSLPLAYLDRHLPQADAVAHRQALAQVEREFATVRQDAGSTLERVRAELVLTDRGYPDLTAMAARLLTSKRTLKRKLSAEGSSFLKLLEEARYRDARQLLEASDLDIQSIAARLGFHNPANFTRAFRRLSGQTPSQVRQLAAREYTLLLS